VSALRHGLAGFGVLLLAGCATPGAGMPESQETSAIEAVLSAQQAAWNRGDIDAFMEGYAQTGEVRFASGGTVTRGWQSTLERYKARYTNRAIMGELTFSGLEVDQVSADAAIVHGAWQLQRAGDAPSGLFTLVLRKGDDGAWRIVSDTTTSAD
jgi:ketosteroid isomerase-like protein